MISGQLWGETYDEEKHGYGVEIKAVSYHMLEISVGPPSTIVIIFESLKSLNPSSLLNNYGMDSYSLQ